MLGRIIRPVLRHRFGVLLTLQMAMLLAAAFAQGSLFKEEIFLLALLAMLVSSGFAILKGTKYLKQLLLMAAVALGCNLYGYISPLPEADMVASIANLAFMAWVMFAMAARVFLNRRVDENIILGAACLYIHVGMMFSFVYLLVDYFVPHSFSMTTQVGGSAEVSRLLGQFLYYSFVTLGTVGYGDIAPITPPSRYISVIEAISGQLYLAILVARLVGMHLSKPDPDKDPSI